MEPIQPKQTLNVPVAIIVAGILIAGAIFITKNPGVQPVNNIAEAPEKQLPPVTADDHILGNPNASLYIIEYSDTSCPFCKLFHGTMKRIMDEYGKTGEVAWVYRHFPLDKPNAEGFVLHPNAGKEAQALECAAELGGNDVFWKYTDRLYEITPSVTSKTPQGLDTAELPRIASYAGLNVNDFNTCLSSGKFAKKVEASYYDGLAAGVAGTPFSFIITKGGKSVPVNGAESYAQVKNAIETLLREE
jgi:protein-disulfide isomerase